MYQLLIVFTIMGGGYDAGSAITTQLIPTKFESHSTCMREAEAFREMQIHSDKRRYPHVSARCISWKPEKKSK